MLCASLSRKVHSSRVNTVFLLPCREKQNAVWAAAQETPALLTRQAAVCRPGHTPSKCSDGEGHSVNDLFVVIIFYTCITQSDLDILRPLWPWAQTWRTVRCFLPELFQRSLPASFRKRATGSGCGEIRNVGSTCFPISALTLSVAGFLKRDRVTLESVKVNNLSLNLNVWLKRSNKKNTFLTVSFCSLCESVATWNQEHLTWCFK